MYTIGKLERSNKLCLILYFSIQKYCHKNDGYSNNSQQYGLHVLVHFKMQISINRIFTFPQVLMSRKVSVGSLGMWSLPTQKEGVVKLPFLNGLSLMEKVFIYMTVSLHICTVYTDSYTKKCDFFNICYQEIK